MTRSYFNQLKEEADAIKAQLIILDSSNFAERKMRFRLKARLWAIVGEVEQFLRNKRKLTICGIS